MTFLVVVLALVIVVLVGFMVGACMKHQRATERMMAAIMEVVTALQRRPNGNGGH